MKFQPIESATVVDEESDPLADSLGIDPVRLDNGCGCDRPRWALRPCGHCSCGGLCNDCPANRIWKYEQESWCGCARPGDKVLPCGHCRCGNGLCMEVVRNGEALVVRRKAACA